MNFICPSCVSDPHIRELVEEESTSDQACDYCNEPGHTAKIQVLVDRVDTVLDMFYEETSTTRAVLQHGRLPEGNDHIALIQQMIRCTQSVAEDVGAELEKSWRSAFYENEKYGSDASFFFKLRTEKEVISHEWKKIEHSIQSTTRFFNPAVKQLLDLIFSGIEEDRDSNERSVIVEAGQGSEIPVLFRARVFQSDDELEDALRHPEQGLGPPPMGIGSAGRMNAQGQPVFYGATAANTAIAEVRPPVGSRVAIGQFKITTPLRLLDLSRLQSVDISKQRSFFDPDIQQVVRRRNFLRVLEDLIALPVMPDRQHTDYLITQAVADYLAANPVLNIDGIIYRSVQTENGQSGRNVVIFQKAARIKNSDSVDPTAEIELKSPIEGSFESYLNPQIYFKELGEKRPTNKDVACSLELVKEEISVHTIKVIQYKFESTKVTCRSTPLI
ncbi:RES family NAD+ phosphorylase [Flavobacterium sp.]|uniref:RES family NAD+ phosphorylase n=1 Tax=Flavobacterium sp. TaxID=239 RepID=UPI00261A669E|nr:RES family NAD+ phosphorylase [Flavobacterium sp.]